MDPHVFDTHQRLTPYPFAKLIYIIYRRLREQGVRATTLWAWDKLYRRRHGVSPRTVCEIQPGFFVGGQQRAQGLAHMAEWGISAVVNMRAESDDAAHEATPEHYLWLPTPDDTPPTFADLERGAAYIAEQRAAGRGVYIHCAAGVGRAPLMGAAYLVTTGLSPAKAWAVITARRPFIRPTPPQIAALEAFAQHWQANKV